MSYSREIKEKAIQLRKKGKSLNEISNELDISKGTASVWLKDYPATNEMKIIFNKRHPRTGFKHSKSTKEKLKTQQLERWKREKKACSRCGEEIEISEFKKRNGRSGYQSYCKKCSPIIQKEYTQKLRRENR